MKTIIYISLALNLFAGIQAQNVREVKAELKHVTVFPDRAQFSQEANVSVTPGKTTVRFTGLSPYIDMVSIQVKGYGDFTIMSVNHQNNYLDNLEESAEVKSLKSQIESLQAKTEDERTSIKVLKEKESFLLANKAILVKETTFSIEQFKSMMELYTSNMEQVSSSVLKKERLIKEYEKQISALQNQLSDKLGRQQLPSGVILVDISSEKQVNAKFTLNYIVGNAGWYPSYDIRVDDIKNPVNIIYKANVFQTTGVIWKDVKLSFSNATPWVSGDVPVFYPWYLDFYAPVPRLSKGRSISYNRSEAPMVMEVASEAKKMEVNDIEAAPLPVEKREGETTVIFDLTAPTTVEPNGKIQTVEIQRITSVAEYKYVSLPKLSPLAYLTANISDWAKLSLLRGEATLYFENTFVGKTNLDVSQLNDTMSISLGTDNSILIKREKKKEFTSSKVIGSNKTETFSFQTTVRNNKTSAPVKITVTDQIPVSSNSSITIEATELTGGKQNPQTGEVRWDLELKPQETRQLIITYTVKYPKDKIVILE